MAISIMTKIKFDLEFGVSNGQLLKMCSLFLCKLEKDSVGDHYMWLKMGKSIYGDGELRFVINCMKTSTQNISICLLE